MENITGLFTVALVGFLLAARSNGNGVSQNNGYCIGNQCFVAFQDPTDFTTAQNNCAEKGGHLMTVRSSVSHDTLFIILGGRFSGEYWIGLHLSSGCPDASTELRGFQWVTQDGESDFYNWGAFDSTCSPRCVSVSKEGDFKWNQESCSKHAAGYLCEYNFQNPCKRLAVRGDESVTYKTPYGFEGEDVLSLPPGSTAVRRPAETKSICFGERWLEAPWSCEIDEGGCEHQCVADDHHASVCFCPPGRVVNPGNNVTCEVFKDDPCLTLRCEQACFHDPTNDTYACMCDHGFELAPDGRTCRDIDDCADERMQCPGDHFACKNTVGAFDCVCAEGYRSTGDGRCADVDECMSAPCEHSCTNTAGSYKCSCFDGYTEVPEEPHKCKLYCGREECPAECDPNDHLQCYCPRGYVADQRAGGVFCVDINECNMGYCDQECMNTHGSYLCSCADGFTLVDAYKCNKDEVDVDTDGWEGSGATTPFGVVFVTPTEGLYPEPTGRPSGVTAGGLLGIIVCIVVVILLLVFLAHHVLKKRGKLESAGGLKTQGDECHDLEHVTTEKYEKTASETTLKQD